MRIIIEVDNNQPATVSVPGTETSAQSIPAPASESAASLPAINAGAAPGDQSLTTGTNSADAPSLVGNVAMFDGGSAPSLSNP